jgi:hypothetical protein
VVREAVVVVALHGTLALQPNQVLVEQVVEVLAAVASLMVLAGMARMRPDQITAQVVAAVMLIPPVEAAVAQV